MNLIQYIKERQRQEQIKRDRYKGYKRDREERKRIKKVKE